MILPLSNDRRSLIVWPQYIFLLLPGVKDFLLFPFLRVLYLNWCSQNDGASALFPVVEALVGRADGEKDPGKVCVFSTVPLLPASDLHHREAFFGLAPTLSPSCEHLERSMKKSLQVGTNSHWVCGSQGFCILMLAHTGLLAVHYIFRWLLTSLYEAWCLPKEAGFASCLSLEEPDFPNISGHLVALWALL